MTTPELLISMGNQGIEIRPDGTDLIVRPKDRLTTTLRAELVARKSEILSHLAAQRVHPGTAADCSVTRALGGTEPTTASKLATVPLTEFATAQRLLEVKSRVLDETVLFASDNATVDPTESRVVYRASELILLLGLGRGALRELHRFKRTFRGSIAAEMPHTGQEGATPSD